MWFRFLLVLALAAVEPAQAPPGSAPSASVSGRVVDAVTGRPVPGAIVTPFGSAVAITPTSPQPPRALTNGDGRFVIRELRPGAVVLVATKNGYATASFDQRRPGGSGHSIPVKDGQRIPDLEIRMWRDSAVPGDSGATDCAVAAPEMAMIDAATNATKRARIDP